MFIVHEGERILFSTSSRPESRPYLELPFGHPEINLSEWKVDVAERKLVLKSEVSPHRTRVALISDWGVNCGIATYSRALVGAMRSQVAELRIFAEDAEVAACAGDAEHGVTRCWSRGKDYSRILPAMRAYNPDLILIQHEYGLFPDLGAWNALLSQLSRWRVVTTLHTVLEHRVDHKEASLDYQCRAIAEAACPEVIVHTPKARECLRDRGYSGRVHMIPHGCFAPSQLSPLPTHKYGMFPRAHSIFQYGFGGRHKGWEFAIDVVEKLVPKYPELIYVGVFNLSAFGLSGQIQYHHELLDRVSRMGLEKHVAIHRGYQSEQMLSNYLRGSRVAFFPYQRPNKHWASWGASGAIQLPIHHSKPLVLSDFPCFQEFDGIFPLCKTVDDAAATIDRIFSDVKYEQQLEASARRIATERAWPKVAAAYLSCKSEKDFNFT